LPLSIGVGHQFWKITCFPWVLNTYIAVSYAYINVFHMSIILYRYIFYPPNFSASVFCVFNVKYVLFFYRYYSSFTYFISRSVGLGFLCLPYAFNQVGVITGLALCFISGLMFTHSFTTLVSTQMFSLEPPWKYARIKYKMWILCDDMRCVC